MKTILSIAILGTILSACSNNNSTEQAGKKNDTTTATTQAPVAANNPSALVDETVSGYLQLKNALTTDNGDEAAKAGKQLFNTLQKLDEASFTPDQKKVYDELKDDMKEQAEHIGDNASKIAHQREHFDMLSQDMYDLVKAVKPSQALFKDYCPMYNKGKGAFWLSETEEIKNPYMGKKMSSCGKVKEEIK